MIRRALGRFASLSHVVHGSVDLAISGLSAVGLDPARRRIPVARLAARRAGLRFHAHEASGRVVVGPPAPGFDPVPGRFAALCDTVSQGYAFQAAGRIEIEHGRFHVPSGVVMTGGAIPSETVLQRRFPRSFQYAGVIRTAHGRARPLPEGVFLGLPLSHGYYHWLCEILPLAVRVGACPELSGLPIYLPSTHPGFVAEHLALLGLSERCVALAPGVYTAPRLHVPTLPSRGEWPSPDHLRLVRDALLHACPAPAGPPRRRIFISRDDAGQRRLLNERPLVERLGDHGFERVSLSGMSAAEQIRLFADARHVVAPHGAGTANILFCPPGFGLVELVGDRHFAPCYQILASVLGGGYRYVRCADRRRDLVAPIDAAVEVVTAAIYEEATPAASR